MVDPQAEGQSRDCDGDCSAWCVFITFQREQMSVSLTARLFLFIYSDELLQAQEPHARYCSCLALAISLDHLSPEISHILQHALTCRLVPDLVRRAMSLLPLLLRQSVPLQLHSLLLFLARKITKFCMCATSSLLLSPYIWIDCILQHSLHSLRCLHQRKRAICCDEHTFKNSNLNF